MARAGRKDRGLFPYELSDGSTWYGVRLYVRGRPFKWQGFKTKGAARNWYEDRKRDIREGLPFPDRDSDGATLGLAIEQYLIQAKNKKNYAGERAYGAWWTSRLGKVPLAHLTAKQLDAERTHLLTVGAGRGPVTHATVNRYVAWLHHVLLLEVRKRTIERNPAGDLAKFEEPKAPEVEYSAEEEAALARELGPEADVPTLAILTGLRQEELLTLAKADVHLDRGYGQVQDPKGGEPQVFLINADAAELLEARMARSSSPWLFPHPKNPAKHLHPKSWYAHVFKPAAIRAGITISRKAGKTFHTLRHTFAARLQQDGVEVKDIKDLGRWKSWKAMDRYLKRDHARLRGAIEKLRVPRGTAPKPPVAGLPPIQKSIEPLDKPATEG